MSKLFKLTLALLKPDVVANPYVLKEIQKTIIANNFLIVKSKVVQLSREEACLFYAEHEGKFFHKRLVNYICSGPLMACILYREDCVQVWRRLMGGTKVYKTIYEDAWSIRGHFGLSDTRNSTHGSDSQETALREMTFFFGDFEPLQWLSSRDSFLFSANHVDFCHEEFRHKVS